jgi:hypothetical protein
VFLFTQAVSSAIGEAFLPLSTDPLLVWNYGAMGCIAIVAAAGFYFSFRTPNSPLARRVIHLTAQGTAADAFVLV